MIRPVICLLLMCGPWAFVGAAAGEAAPDGARIVRRAGNPEGLQIGFWANYRHSADVLRDFGPRPIERVNFHKWRQHELEPGVYSFDGQFTWERWAHLAGSTVVTNVNTFHTLRINPQGMPSMPEHVDDDITNPETRAGARAYLRAFTHELLRETGTAWLVLDYELFWFALPRTQEIRRNYRDWFVEAAGVCREAAAEIGMGDRLKIGLVVNGDPYDNPEHSLGAPVEPTHEPQDWLLDCVRTADFLGIDTYTGGRYGSVTPEYQLRAIRFWIEHYALDKPVYVTESGFSTVREHDPSSRGYHSRGTEAEQAAFFDAMFRSLVEAKSDPGDPLGRVRGYCIWNYLDREDQHSLLEKHFGIRRVNGSPKPAFGVVSGWIDRIESDLRLAPTRVESVEEVLADLRAGRGVEIERRSGVDYDTIVLGVPASARGEALTVETRTAEPVCLSVGAGDAWFTTHPREARVCRIDLPPGVVGEEMELVFTAGSYPLRTSVTGVRLLTRGGEPAPETDR